MKPAKFKFVALPVLLLLLLVAGCSSTQLVSEHKYPAVSPESVQVLYQEPQRPYEVIAFMNKVSGIEHPGSGDVASLREDAAELGADAVIVTNSHGMSFFQYAEASIKAIKWTAKSKEGQRGGNDA